MTFDKWIDSVNSQVRGRLGESVRTEELSWDSAMWVGQNGTAVAMMTNDEQQAVFSFDNGEKVTFTIASADADTAANTVATRLSR
jgi:hypothetical protein